MKKLITRDNKLRKQILQLEIKQLVLKSIFKNFNFFTLIRWNAFIKLNNLSKNANKIACSNRCLFSVNKKRFNKLTNVSRHVYLKLIRSNKITGITKSSW